jgi:biopolymer transport protein ExbB
MAYGYKASITIDNTKVSGSSNLTNFPMLFSGTYDGTDGEPDLRTTANDGNIENTDATGGVDGATTVPADFAFFSDSDLTTALDFEVEDYDASTGEIVAWVEVPTLDVDADTVIYIGYGDSSVTTSQEDVSGTWNSNYISVFHMGSNNNSATGNNFTKNGGLTYSTTQGTINKGIGDFSSGVDPSFSGNNARLVTTLTEGTKYWRVRAEQQ